MVLFLQVKKVYLIQITELVPRRLDLETVWMLDAESRSVQKAEVERLTDLDDPTELVLRIRYSQDQMGVQVCSSGICVCGKVC